MATPAMMTAALASAQVGRSGIGSGVVNSARQIGGALGVALFGSLISASATFVIGFRQIVVLAAAALLAAGAACLLSIPPQSGAERK